MKQFYFKSLFIILGTILFCLSVNSSLFAQKSRPIPVKKSTVQNGVQTTAQKLLEDSEKLIATDTPEALKAAMPKLNQAAQLFIKSGNEERLAVCYNLLGGIYDSFDDLNTAISFYNKSLAIFEKLKDADGMSLVLNNIGYSRLRGNNYSLALANFSHGLEIAEKADLLERQLLILYNAAITYTAAGNKQQATDFYKRALKISEKTNNIAFQFLTLSALGGTSLEFGERREAVEYLSRALQLPAEASSDENRFAVINNLAQAYDGLGERQKALDFYNQALNLIGTADLPFERATVLNNTGLVYLSLGDSNKALEKFQQAREQVNKLNGEIILVKRLLGRILNNIGAAHDFSGNADEATKFYSQSAEISAQAKDLKMTATTLNNLVIVLLKLNEPNEIIGILDKVFPVIKASEDKELESIVLNNYARAYELLNNPSEAATRYMQSLAIAREGGYKSVEAQALNNLMFLWDKRKNPNLAVFFGKQSVNVFQTLRTDIKNLDGEAQKKYLESVSHTYRKLADIFINLGRLPEAEQILAMLKEQEYLEFTQRSGDAAKKMLGDIKLTDEETKAVARYEEIAEKLTQKGLEFEKLKKQIPKNDEEKALLDKRRAELAADIESATTAFNLILQQIEKEFSASTVKTNVEVSTAIGGADDLQSKLRRSKLADTVIISTIVTDENLYLILTTPTVKIVEKSPVKSTELNRLTQTFRKTLQHPKVDPRPSGEKLYELIFKPLEKHLASLEAQAGDKPLTLVWSLDGALRYVPISALWNGKQYLVEKYQNVIFTLASRAEFDKASGDNWRGLGLGVSKAWGDFDALPSVKDELLQGAIQAENVPGSKGIIAGKVLLDQDFTAQSFADSLSAGDYSMIHIASHFSLQPGGYAKSFLLLGTGEELSLEKIQKSPEFVFDNVELLTLSACNTAIGGTDANGREIEGFAKLAQDKGARAVMATLWAVADESTRDFMAEFYRERQEKHLTKAESLRMAQLSLLNGSFKTEPGKQTRRSDLAGQTSDDVNSQPPFQADPNKPFAHPYFWSPFVLIGNWR